MEREEDLAIYYVVVGAFLEEFVVILQPSEDVAALKVAIKAASIGLDDVDLDELELYLAEQPTGGWLPCDSDELKALKEGDEVTINRLCVTPLAPVDKLSQHFDAATLGRRNIHILVKICYKMTVEERRRILKKLALIQDLQWRLKMRIYRYALDVREETINIYEAIDADGKSRDFVVARLHCNSFIVFVRLCNTGFLGHALFRISSEPPAVGNCHASSIESRGSTTSGSCVVAFERWDLNSKQVVKLCVDVGFLADRHQLSMVDWEVFARLHIFFY